jgi:hypothetical protein
VGTLFGSQGDPSSLPSWSEGSVREYASLQADQLVSFFNTQAKQYASSILNGDGIDFDTSNRSYSLKLKSRWTSVNIGVPGWSNPVGLRNVA